MSKFTLPLSPLIPSLPADNAAVPGYLNQLQLFLRDFYFAVANAINGTADIVDTGADLAAHEAATGTAVHGLGTMATATATDYLAKAGNLAGLGSAAASRTNLGLGTIATQAADSVNIDGGSIDSTALTACTYTGNATSLNFEREAISAKGNISGSTVITWTASGCVTATVTGASAAFTHSSLPSGVMGFMTLDITNGGVATDLLGSVKWPGGTPIALTASGRDIISLMCHDGATVNVVSVLLDMQ